MADSGPKPGIFNFYFGLKHSYAVYDLLRASRGKGIGLHLIYHALCLGRRCGERPGPKSHTVNSMPCTACACGAGANGRTGTRTSTTRAATSDHCSAIYGFGYNSCGCNLRLSEVWSGSFGIDSGPLCGSLGPKPDPNQAQKTPTGLRAASNCSHMSCSHIYRSQNGVCMIKDVRSVEAFPTRGPS